MATDQPPNGSADTTRSRADAMRLAPWSLICAPWNLLCAVGRLLCATWAMFLNWSPVSAVLDLMSASYYATEWYDSVINPDEPEVLQVVAKTRGKTQYYQNQGTFAFNLTWHDLKAGVRPMVNETAEMSELEAAALNHALSVRRKAVGGLVVLGTGVVLEACGVDISLFT